MAEILYPVAEVAEMWRCSKDYVYDLVARGELITVPLSSSKARSRAKIRIPESSLTAFIKRRKEKAPKAGASALRGAA